MRRPSTRHDVSPADQAGYLELLRGNVDFRRLWIGNVISLLGDWFNTIALYTLITQLTGSPLALGAVFIVKMLPWALASPLAGVIVDRFDRRRLMLGSDLLRAVIVLGFLLVEEPGHVAWLYVLIAAQVVVGSVFQPAKSASIPNLTAPRELLTANALSSATWSTMLALGAALGGLATEWLGTDAVFVLDSLTYVWSAYFIWRTRIPQETDAPTRPLLQAAYGEIADGLRHLRGSERIRRIAFAKATWASAGGGLVYMLALLGDRIAPSALAAGIGVLFMARGIGTGIGPIVARALFHDDERWPSILGLCIVASGLCYGAAAFVPWGEALPVVLALVGLVAAAHMASGANWVLATVLLQKRTEDRYRGRIFATEWLLVMTANSVSTFAASVLLEWGVLTLEQAFLGFAGLQVLSGLLWQAVVVPAERRAAALDA